jgi:hypothetical protein
MGPHQGQCPGVLSDALYFFSLKKSSLGLVVASINVSLRVSGGPHSAEARQAQKHYFCGDDRVCISATSSRTRSTFYIRNPFELQFPCGAKEGSSYP